MCQENQTKSLPVYHEIKPAGFLFLEILNAIPRAVWVLLLEIPEGAAQEPRRALQEAVREGFQGVLRVTVSQQVFLVFVPLEDAHSSQTNRLR